MEPTRVRGRVSSAHAFARPAPAKNPHPRGALRALLTAAKVSPTARSIAAALWTYCDPFGRCYPSQRTLARVTGRCERTVRAAVKELERAGVLRRDVPDLTERRRSRRTTVYRFTVGAWREQPPPPPRREPQPVEPREFVDQVPDLEAADDAPAVEWGELEVLEAVEAPPVAVEVCDAIAGTLDTPPMVTEARDETSVTELDQPGPLLGFVGWTLVDVPLEERSTPPATAAARSPATHAARRPQGMNIPPTPNARPMPRRTVGGWASTRPGVARVPMPEALSRALARVANLARARAG